MKEVNQPDKDLVMLDVPFIQLKLNGRLRTANCGYEKMAIDYQCVYEAIKIVLAKREAQKTVVSSVKCGVITGLTTFGACALLGPLGVFAGAAVGSTVAYSAYKNKFKSILEVMEEDLSDEEKQELAEKVQKVMDKFEIDDAVRFLSLIQGNVSIEKEFFLAIRSFIDAWQENQRPFTNTKTIVNTNANRNEMWNQLCR